MFQDMCQRYFLSITLISSLMFHCEVLKVIIQNDHTFWFLVVVFFAADSCIICLKLDIPRTKFSTLPMYPCVHRLPNPPIDADNPILKASTKPKTRRKLPNPKHPTTHSIDSDL